MGIRNTTLWFYRPPGETNQSLGRAQHRRALGMRGDQNVPELRTLVAGIIQLNAFLCIELNVEWPARSPPL